MYVCVLRNVIKCIFFNYLGIKISYKVTELGNVYRQRKGSRTKSQIPYVFESGELKGTIKQIEKNQPMRKEEN